MKTMKPRYAWLTAALTATMIGAGTFWAIAQPPAAITDLTMVEGKFVKPTINDHNDPDGWKLESGEVIHIPPHAYSELQSLVKPGDVVRVMTQNMTLRDGKQVNEAVTIQVGDRTVAIASPTPPKPPKPKNEPGKDEEPMKAKGTIVSFHENPHGDVDGFTLSDDTEVKFPPHNGESLMEGMEVGTEVDVKGRRHETPKGDIHLHADEITAAGYVYTIDQPKHPKPPKHGPGHDDWMTKKQADDMLEEMRAIRKLLEDRK